MFDESVTAVISTILTSLKIWNVCVTLSISDLFRSASPAATRSYQLVAFGESVQSEVVRLCLLSRVSGIASTWVSKMTALV